MADEKDKTSQEKEKEASAKSIADKTWEDDDDWMEDPSGINPGC